MSCCRRSGGDNDEDEERVLGVWLSVILWRLFFMCEFVFFSLSFREAVLCRCWGKLGAGDNVAACLGKLYRVQCTFRFGVYTFGHYMQTPKISHALGLAEYACWVDIRHLFVGSVFIILFMYSTNTCRSGNYSWIMLSACWRICRVRKKTCFEIVYLLFHGF